MLSLEKFIEDYDLYVEKYLKISIISEELAKLPTQYGLFLNLMLSAKKDFEIAEAHFEILHSQKRSELLNQKSKLGVKLTERQLDNIVDQDDDVCKGRLSLIEIKNKYEQVKEFLTALSYKKDMLIQLSANERQEQKLYQ